MRVKLAEPKLNQVAESGVDELEEISHPGRKEVHLRARFNPERLTKFKRSLPVEVVGYDDRLVALGPSSRSNIWHPLFRDGKRRRAIIPGLRLKPHNDIFVPSLV